MRRVATITLAIGMCVSVQPSAAAAHATSATATGGSVTRGLPVSDRIGARTWSRVRTVERRYGGPAVRLREGETVLRLRFRGRRGDKVSLHAVDRFAHLPINPRRRSCSRLRLRSDRGPTWTSPDSLHALTLRRNGWQTLVYRRCGRMAGRPSRVRLMKWDVRPLTLDGSAAPYSPAGGHVAAFTVRARAGQWVHLATDDAMSSRGPRQSYPGFRTDLPDLLVPADGTYTFVENANTRRYEPRTSSVRARTIQAVPAMRSGESRTFTADGSGRWTVTSISLDGLHELRATGAAMAPANGWTASLSRNPPVRCSIHGPLGCGDGTTMDIDASGTYYGFGVVGGTYRILFRPAEGATGTVDLVVAACPDMGCPPD